MVRCIQVGLIYCNISIGSIAALIQSVIFGGQTAGWFSVLQGIGATATISPPVVAVGCTLAVVGAALYFLSPRQQEVGLSIEFWMYEIDADIIFCFVVFEFRSIALESGPRDGLIQFVSPAGTCYHPSN